MKQLDYFILGGMILSLIFILVLLILCSAYPRILPTPRAFGPMI